MIRKQDVQFHEKIMGELKELNFLKNELTKGFEKLQQKSSLESNDKITQKTQKTLLANCDNCTTKKYASSKIPPLTERSHSPQPKHLRATSHIISHTHRESVIPAEPISTSSANEYSVPKEEEIYRKDGRRPLGRASSLSKMEGFNLNRLEKEEPLKNNNSSRFARKYFIAADQNQRKEDPKVLLNRSQTGIFDYSNDEKTGNYFSSVLMREHHHEDEQRSVDISRATNSFQTLPEKWFVKLSKSPYTYGNFTLKFAAAHLTFDVEIKMNETANIDFSKKLMTAKLVNNHEDSSCSRSCLNTNRFEGETKIDFAKDLNSYSPLGKARSNSTDLGKLTYIN